MKVDSGQLTVDTPSAAPLGEPGEGGRLKACYYCGTRVPADAPRCGRCGNDRSFTWTGETQPVGADAHICPQF
ncbi:MAG: hypothetical protein FWC27_03675 [Firmicutes bacterium]|nr:hypothetical protein [Bacillota bacterium]